MPRLKGREFVACLQLLQAMYGARDRAQFRTLLRGLGGLVSDAMITDDELDGTWKESGVGLLHPDRPGGREAFLVHLLRAHLRQAFLNAEAMELHGLVSQTLEKARQGVMLLDEDLRPRAESGITAQLLKAYFGKRVNGGGALPEEISRWLRSELSALTVRNDRAFPRAAMAVERGDRRLLIRLIEPPPRCTLLFSERENGADASLLQRLGLTPKEAVVLSWMAQGKRDSEIATLVGSSRRTVEKHLEHIYAKLKVKSRTGAAWKALDFLSALRD